MTKYKIEHCCGHTEIHNITGSKWYREKRKDILSGRVCKKCWEEENRKKAEELISKNKEEGLPELQGSEKQVRWAVQIRNTALKSLEKLYRRLKEKDKEAEKAINLDSDLSLIPNVEQNEIYFLDKQYPKLLNYDQYLEIYKKHYLDYLRKAINLLKKQDRAKFWIDNRDLFNSMIYSNYFPVEFFADLIWELEGLSTYWTDIFTEEYRKMRNKLQEK